MRRGLWFAAGAGAGVYAAAKARRVAEAFTADGLRDRWEGVRAGARIFAAETAAGRDEKEGELRERLGLAGSAPELSGSAPVTALAEARPAPADPFDQEGTST